MAFRGIQYNGKQTEYQYFPEDYFSGSDVSLYFDDVYMDDVQALEFGLTERVMPVYGYNSYTADAFARGQRIVQGSFTIAFKEAGYVYRIMEHIGQHKQNSKPLLSYYLGEGDKSKPKWLGNVNETIEELLNREAGMTTESATVEQVPNWPNMSLPGGGEACKQFQNWVLQNAGGTRYKGIYVVQTASYKGPYKVNGRYNDMKSIKKRLNVYLFESGAKLISKALDVNSTLYDTTTVNAVKAFQKHFSSSLAVDGLIGPKTMAVLNLGLTANGTFDAPTKLAVMMFQKGNGLAIDGVLGPNTRSKMKVTVTVSKEIVRKGAEADFAEYEASVWGEQSTYDPAFKSSPYFYGSKNQEWLLADGFDIYINYGQLPDDYRGGSSTNEIVTYNNTVRAIRNVQLTGVQQVLSPTGEPIAERYMFIAKDLD